MSKILKINEFASNGQKEWVAIEVTTKDHFGKTTSSQRVVTVETYNTLRNSEYTRGGMEIVSVRALSQPTANKEYAESYLDKKEKHVISGNIDKNGCDYLVSVISVGPLTSNGKTKFDWNIWEAGEQAKKNGGDTCFYVSDYGIILWGAKGSFKIGDTVMLIDNDTRRKVNAGTGKIKYIFNANSKEEFISDVRSTDSQYKGKITYSFGRRTDGVQWNNFRTVYSIKGIE